jgi:hypothetical protein
MLKCVLLSVMLSATSFASTAEHPDDRRPASFAEKQEHRNEATTLAQSLFDEVVTWLCANFDLSMTTDRPRIEFASKDKLLRMRIADRAEWQGFTQEEMNPATERNVVAVYDTISKTIFLPDGWIGKSVADQSILVHEMVHHLQNLAQEKFECPAAREKAAYLAQDKWLARFGTSLEKEFELDMFTVVMSSACM